MEKLQARLRDQIERHRADKAQPNLRFPAALRREILQYAQAHRAGGEGVHAIARGLGLNPNTLYGWLGSEMKRSPFRPVRVVATRAKSVAPVVVARGAVLVTPQGFRVEGLEPETLAVLLRALA